MEVSLQLYSIHEETKKDFRASVEQVAKLGYSGVEFAGYGGLSAEELKSLLKENNLYSVGTHTGLQVFENSFDEELKLSKAIGSKYIICPYAEVDTIEKIDKLVNLLNSAAKKAAGEGIKVGYHNHAHEFTEIDGRFPLDIIAENTDDNVILELDVFWVAYAGVDPVEYIKKWGKKVELIHLKQMDGDKANVDMADGILDMKKIKDASVYANYFVVEHEEYDKPVWDGIKNDFDYLRQIV
ncbi:sugar phosphate isomerase/epimerase [Anaerocolumna sp. AGMB13025]|uniref:sugar phosphate isomerase/epimerase family protein n=1 Tax=Anaerocolumna sp. AGMB13025 TaxID=3039116 RepID=UPI00241CD910|nr:sugar phosphate isomerase/epimerase [Anaerocolumna sp. AGMB13025]WFR58098.1 sugar phosphate isomerase/epimerase [Anaerocolumna sp. AGMB13025]